MSVARVAFLRIDLHFELALVRRIRILAVLGAADLLGDALDARNLRQRLRDAFADARGFGERDARAAARRARSDSSRENPAAGARRAAAAGRCRRCRSTIRIASRQRADAGRSASIVRTCQRLQRVEERSFRAAAGDSS